MKTKKQRLIDKNTKETIGWFGESFTYISKTNIKLWKVALVILFIVGALFSLILSISLNIHSSSEAAKFPPVLIRGAKVKNKINNKNKNQNSIVSQNKPSSGAVSPQTSIKEQPAPQPVPQPAVQPAPQPISQPVPQPAVPIPNTPPPNKTVETSSVKPLNRIGTRVVNNQAEFYDKVTNSTFIPRGNTYIDLNGYVQKWGPYYDSSKAEAALGWMEHDKYNVVRIFPWSGNIKDSGVDPSYMNSIVDFITRANAHHLYVIIGFGEFDAPLGYKNMYTALPQYLEGDNAVVMDQNRINTARLWMVDFLNYIKKSDPKLMSTIMADEVFNEPYYKSDQKPFSLNSGNISVCGGNYDLANVQSRQNMAYDCAKSWINQVTKAVKDIDPNILVGTPVFTPYAVGRQGYTGVQPSNDPREPFSLQAIYDSNADYIDTHIYRRADNYDLSVELSTAGINSLGNKKPRIMGEFGALKNTGFFPNTVPARTVAFAMRAVQIASCALNYKGWVFYTWNTTEKWHNDTCWNVLDGDQSINGILAPIDRPDACSDFFVGGN